MKFSASLPDDLYQRISNEFPDLPFSTALARIIRKSYGLPDPESNEIWYIDSVGKRSLAPDLDFEIRKIVIEELKKKSTLVTFSQKNEIDPEIEYTQAALAKILPPTYQVLTWRGRINRAITHGVLLSNGEHGDMRRVKGADAIIWANAGYPDKP